MMNGERKTVRQQRPEKEGGERWQGFFLPKVCNCVRLIIKVDKGVQITSGCHN